MVVVNRRPVVLLRDRFVLIISSTDVGVYLVGRMRRRSGVLVSRGQVVITEKAEGGRSDRGDGMKDGSGLFLVRLALRLSRPPQAAGRTKLELRVRHTKAKGRKAAVFHLELY